MIFSEILREKNRVQKELSGESRSIHEYLMRSHLAAREVAASCGVHLRYADIPDKMLHRNILFHDIKNIKEDTIYRKPA
jgi:hypothetical protein